MQKKITIKNRQNKTIRGIKEWSAKGDGPVVILAHGLGVTHQQPQVKLVAQALAKAGYTTFRFTATNSIGKSGGSFLDFTVSGYIQDIKLVIKHALETSKQNKYAYIGYSVGAMAGYIIASQDSRIQALVLQGPLYDLKAEMSRKIYMPMFKALDWTWKFSKTADKKFKLGYGFYHDGIKYQPDDYLDKVTCPSMVIYGTKEMFLNKSDFIELFSKLRCEKKLIKISGAGHTIRTKKRINKLSCEIIKWLKKVDHENQTEKMEKA